MIQFLHKEMKFFSSVNIVFKINQNMWISFHLLLYKYSLHINIYNQLCSHDMFLFQFFPHMFVIHQDIFRHLMDLEPKKTGKVIPYFTKSLFNSGNIFMTLLSIAKQTQPKISHPLFCYTRLIWVWRGLNGPSGVGMAQVCYVRTWCICLRHEPLGTVIVS